MSLTDSIVVIGHRGAAGLEPENTLASFRRAYRCGVNAVELDVYALADELVVIHDPTVERTTDGSGAVAAYSLQALRRLDAGNGERVPLLAEVVAELPADVGLNVELKGPGTAAPTARFLDSLTDLDVLVSSFDHTELAAFRRLAPAIRVAPLFARWRASAWQTAQQLNAWAINLSRRIVTGARLAQARRQGLRSFVYTVNDLEEAGRLLDLGATGLFTDYPDRITPAVLAGRSRAAGDTSRP